MASFGCLVLLWSVFRTGEAHKGVPWDFLFKGNIPVKTSTITDVLIISIVILGEIIIANEESGEGPITIFLENDNGRTIMYMKEIHNTHYKILINVIICWQIVEVLLLLRLSNLKNKGTFMEFELTNCWSVTISDL